MRALVVVKVNDPFQEALAFFNGRDGHLVYPFPFKNAIYTLCNGIFKRVSTLCHTNAYSTAGKDFHVRMTTVLAAPVGMMDKATGIQSGYG
jgi:hypothetical protein